ncbi:hypothetical protein Tco_0252878 [Tanacetum coccineum]
MGGREAEQRVEGKGVGLDRLLIRVERSESRKGWEKRWGGVGGEGGALWLAIGVGAESGWGGVGAEKGGREGGGPYEGTELPWGARGVSKTKWLGVGAGGGWVGVGAGFVQWMITGEGAGGGQSGRVVRVRESGLVPEGTEWGSGEAE